MLTDLKPPSQPWNITEDASEHILEKYVKMSLWSRCLNAFFGQLFGKNWMFGAGGLFFS